MIYTKQDAFRVWRTAGRILARVSGARLLIPEKCLYLCRLLTLKSVYRILFIELQKWKSCNRTGLTGRVRADTKGTDSTCPFEVLPLPVVRKPGSVPFVLSAGPRRSRHSTGSDRYVGYRAKWENSIGPVFFPLPIYEKRRTHWPAVVWFRLAPPAQRSCFCSRCRWAPCTIMSIPARMSEAPSQKTASPTPMMGLKSTKKAQMMTRIAMAIVQPAPRTP